MNPARNLLPIVFLFIAFSGGAFLIYMGIYGKPAAPQQATVLPETRALPEFQLSDHNGEPFTRDSLLGNRSLVFFGFTNCPDICPATLQQLAIARQRLAADGQDFPRIILVSVDPERDSPEILAKYVSHFDAGVIGVTGSVDEITRLTKPLGIYFAKSGDLDGNYNVDHSAVILLLNAEGEWHAVFSAPHTIDSLVHDIPLLTGSS
jgi:protein SCO1/2